MLSRFGGRTEEDGLDLEEGRTGSDVAAGILEDGRGRQQSMSNETDAPPSEGAAGGVEEGRRG